MGYKGMDLDLRTPQPRGPVSGHAPAKSSVNGGSRSQGVTIMGTAVGTLWVDETLLACCNHAYDVAFAHRAAEVRIEHLLYAITRVDAASEVLESHGVRDAGLRRESAMVIASGIPVGIADDTGSPSGSPDFEDALQLASSYAAHNNRAASVADLLHVFTAIRPDLPGLELLRHHMPALSDTRSPISTFESRPGLHNIVAASTDATQDTRLAALEQMVRSLGQDIALERNSHGGATRDARAGIGSSTSRTRPAAPPVQTFSAGARVDAGQMESNSTLVAKLDLLSGQLSDVTDRLKTLEHSIANDVRHDGGDVEEIAVRLDTRLNDIEIALLSQDDNPKVDGSLGQRFEELRDTFNEQIDNFQQNFAVQLTSLHEQREQSAAALGAEVKALAGATATHAASADRNAASTRESLDTLTEVRTSFVSELDEVHGAIMKLNANQHTLADEINAWRNDPDNSLENIGTRLGVIETNLGKRKVDGESISENIAKLSSSMDSMHRATIERYHRRNRFWFWLFGTDDWIGASWPSQTARIEDELRALKTMRETGTKS